MNTNEFAGRFFNCPESGGSVSPTCLQYSGDFQLRANGITLQIWQNLIALICLSLSFYLIAGILFFAFPVKIKMSKQPQTAISNFKGFDPTNATTLEGVRGLRVVLKDYALDIKKLGRLGKASSKKPIINPLSTVFEPRTMNVIL
jgi:hypothetical protein